MQVLTQVFSLEAHRFRICEYNQEMPLERLVELIRKASQKTKTA